MMKLSQAVSLINSVVGHKQGPLIVAVMILDAKQSYGQLRFSITPAQGSGSIWVNASSLQLGPS